jgi:23S rRNA (uracil1939-C5)-methyltransferase
VSTAVRIERIAAGGDGVGRLPDGRAVFVPRTAPGDEVELTDLRLLARFARARVGQLLVPGPDRVDARCAHYERDRCGGCQLQHLSLDAQRAARRGIVGDALRRIGRLDVEDPPLTAVGEPWGYRHRITLHAGPSGGHYGFHRAGDPGQIFDLERCEIAAAPLNRIWEAVRAARSALPPALDQVVLQLSRDGQAHVVLRGPMAPTADGLERLKRVVAGCGIPVAWWWEPARGGVRRLGENGTAAVVEPTSFEQVNPEAGQAVRGHALELLGALAGRHVWDLYAGVGDATVALHARGATVESVEVDSAAVTAASRGGSVEGITRHTGPVESWVAKLARPDVVFTNPPRTGMGGKVVDAIAAAAPTEVVYLSCDPATLGRDLARFGVRYRVTSVRAFDLFPQTAHVETVVRLERT